MIFEQAAFCASMSCPTNFECKKRYSQEHPRSHTTYLRKLLAVFFLLQLLPVPVDLDVLLMRLDHFVLDFIRTFFLGFLLVAATSAVKLLGVRFDFYDALFRLPAHLLKNACTNVARVSLHEKLQGSRLVTEQSCGSLPLASSIFSSP